MSYCLTAEMETTRMKVFCCWSFNSHSVDSVHPNLQLFSRQSFLWSPDKKTPQHNAEWCWLDGVLVVTVGPQSCSSALTNHCSGWRTWSWHELRWRTWWRMLIGSLLAPLLHLSRPSLTSLLSCLPLLCPTRFSGAGRKTEEPSLLHPVNITHTHLLPPHVMVFSLMLSLHCFRAPSLQIRH